MPLEFGKYYDSESYDSVSFLRRDKKKEISKENKNDTEENKIL